jgi:hypothetical protein
MNFNTYDSQDSELTSNQNYPIVYNNSITIIASILFIIYIFNAFVMSIVWFYTLFLSVQGKKTFSSKLGNFMLAFFLSPLYILKYIHQCATTCIVK